MVNVASLSDKELAALLDEYSIMHGPLLRTTRSVYEKRLRAALSSGTAKSPSRSASIQSPPPRYSASSSLNTSSFSASREHHSSHNSSLFFSLVRKLSTSGSRRILEEEPPTSGEDSDVHQECSYEISTRVPVKVGIVSLSKFLIDSLSERSLLMFFFQASAATIRRRRGADEIITSGISSKHVCLQHFDLI